MGMAQVVATIAYGIRGLRRGETTWGWPDFDADPEQENLAQISRWSLNSAPAWEFPPLAIANQYQDPFFPSNAFMASARSFKPINTRIHKRTK